ncbi:MAG: dTDP-glucose 4,6-dehydratase [Candidatus Heimdallarchaeota archaeon]
MQKLLVTGGAGFIGSNFIRYWLTNHSEDEILNLDKLTYAGNLENLKEVPLKHGKRYKFVQGDIANFQLVNHLFETYQPEIIVNFAAESHNSLAILNPRKFMMTNAVGLLTLLDVVRSHQIKRFHHISTCEVYGDLELDSPYQFQETSPYNPKTPYNASKAAGDHIVRSYFHTFKVPVTITNCSNNYGPYQFPEKVIPLFTINALEGKPLPIYESSQNKREWLHVLDHCRAIELVLEKGKIGETYNVGSGIEKSVDELAEIILKEIDAPKDLKQIVPDRPQHDKRYFLDSSKIRLQLGWKPTTEFQEGIRDTIGWYRDHPEWWKPLKARLQVNEASWKE